MEYFDCTSFIFLSENILNSVNLICEYEKDYAREINNGRTLLCIKVMPRGCEVTAETRSDFMNVYYLITLFKKSPTIKGTDDV